MLSLTPAGRGAAPTSLQRHRKWNFTHIKEAPALVMSRERLPLIGSSRAKKAKPPLSSPAPSRPHQASRRKRSQQQTTSSASSSQPGPPSVLLSDSTMTPWAGLPLSEPSFASIPPPPPARPPPPPPAPQPTPTTPYHGRQSDDEEVLSLSFNSPSPPAAVPLDSPGRGVRELRVRQRVLPQRRVPRPPRLPPLQPITNLSFSRSFTFSFFELPLHQSPRFRAERLRNLMLLLRQIHY